MSRPVPIALMHSTIFLVRHLPTDGRPAGRIGRHEFASWLSVEAGRGVVAGSLPSYALTEAVAGSLCVAVSPLARAQATADAVLASLPTGHRHPRLLVIENLREAALPVISMPRLRASIDVWDWMSRVTWLSGFSGGVEPRSAVAERARLVAAQLDELARDGSVTVIGHGFFNAVLARPLRRLGWIGPRLPRHGNGSVTPFVRPTP